MELTLQEELDPEWDIDFMDRVGYPIRMYKRVWSTLQTEAYRCLAAK